MPKPCKGNSFVGVAVSGLSKGLIRTLCAWRVAIGFTSKARTGTLHDGRDLRYRALVAFQPHPVHGVGHTADFRRSSVSLHGTIEAVIRHGRFGRLSYR